MDRKAKIEKLKAIQEGRIKPLEGQIFVWEQKGKIYRCENKDYEHLKLTEKQFNVFCDKYGGKHIVFAIFKGEQEDEPIKEQTSDHVTRWSETKTYDQESPKEAITKPSPPEIPAKAHKRRNKAAKPVQQVVKPNTRAKEKAALEKCLKQMEADKQRAENMNSFKSLNKDFFSY